MSKSMTMLIGLLACCLGVFIGVLAMSSQVEEYKKEKGDAEAELTRVIEKAELDFEESEKRIEAIKKSKLSTELNLKTRLNKTQYVNNQLKTEISRLKEELVEARNVQIGEGETSETTGFTSKKEVNHEESSEESPRAFLYKNVSFRRMHTQDTTEVIGEITNHSNNHYRIAFFNMSVYGNNEKLLDTVVFIIRNFENGQTRSFHTYIDVDPSIVIHYKINYEQGNGFDVFK